jgi:hypothetical protein
MHDALGRFGPVLPCTSDKAAAELLPPGFEWMPFTYAGRLVYAACRRAGLDGEWPHPHHGQRGRTLALSMCRPGRSWRVALPRLSGHP